MREIRSSGSVEGVMRNHDPYSDSDAREMPFDRRWDSIGPRRLGRGTGRLLAGPRRLWLVHATLRHRMS